MESDRYALFGHPVSHSRSPEIHHHFAQQTGESLHYELIDVLPDDFAATVRDFFARGGRGGNVTLPHKLAAFELADHLSSDACRAGAVNTFALLEDGSLFGDNTDGAGLIRDLAVNHGVRIEGRRVLLVGAGGAARGALGPLLDEGPAETVIANRHAEKAQRLARLFGSAVVAGALPDARGPFDIVINATSASLHGNVPDLPQQLFARGAVAYDMVYLDEPTAFLRWSKAQGAAHCIDGWGMMVEQAAESFFIWRDVRPGTASILRKELRM